MTARDRTIGWVGLVLGTVWLFLGCGPANLFYPFLLFQDNKIPAECKLGDSKREVTVALVSSFPTRNITRLELIKAEEELAEALAMDLTVRFKENKEKVKFVPLGQIRSHQNRMSARGVVSPHDIGTHFKADYVINLEINAMELYEQGSRGGLFRGKTDIGVQVLDMSKPGGEGLIFDKSYNREYPRTGARDAFDTTSARFRTEFLVHVARDLGRFFSAFPADQRHSTLD